MYKIAPIYFSQIKGSVRKLFIPLSHFLRNVGYKVHAWDHRIRINT